MANTRTDLEELDAFIKLADANPSAKATARGAFEFMKTRITKLEAAKRRLEDVGVVVMTDEDFDPTYDELYGLYEKQKARITELESALMIREDAQTQGAVNAVNSLGHTRKEYEDEATAALREMIDTVPLAKGPQVEVPDAPSDRLMRIEARLDALEDRLA